MGTWSVPFFDAWWPIALVLTGIAIAPLLLLILLRGIESALDYSADRMPRLTHLLDWIRGGHNKGEMELLGSSSSKSTLREEIRFVPNGRNRVVKTKGHQDRYKWIPPED